MRVGGPGHSTIKIYSHLIVRTSQFIARYCVQELRGEVEMLEQSRSHLKLELQAALAVKPPYDKAKVRYRSIRKHLRLEILLGCD